MTTIDTLTANEWTKQYLEIKSTLQETTALLASEIYEKAHKEKRPSETFRNWVASYKRDTDAIIIAFKKYDTEQLSKDAREAFECAQKEGLTIQRDYVALETPMQYDFITAMILATQSIRLIALKQSCQIFSELFK